MIVSKYKIIIIKHDDHYVRNVKDKLEADENDTKEAIMTAISIIKSKEDEFSPLKWEQ